MIVNNSIIIIQVIFNGQISQESLFTVQKKKKRMKKKENKNMKKCVYVVIKKYFNNNKLTKKVKMCNNYTHF